MNTKAVGENSEGAILSRMLMLGLSVAIPFGNNQRYDLVMDTNAGLLRVQCKTGRLKNGAITFPTRSCNGFTGQKRNYVGEADVFMVFCPDNAKIYRVPITAGTNADEMVLRVDPPRNGQVAKINWARDFEF